MKIHIRLYILSLTVCFCLFYSERMLADPQNKLANETYSRLRGAEGTSIIFVWDWFKKEVPPSEVDSVLAAVIDRAADDPEGGEVVVRVMLALEGLGPTYGWSQHLENSLLAQTRRDDIAVRAMAVSLFATHDKNKYRQLCLSYLNDPDDVVRSRAISTVYKWPDGQDILHKYIAEHGSASDHVASVRSAQLLIDN